MNFSTSRLESLPWGFWGLQTPRLRHRSKSTFERFASWFWWRWRKWWVWKTSFAARGSRCAKASSNTPTNKGEGRADANGTPYESLEAPVSESPDHISWSQCPDNRRQRLRYPSAAAQRRHAYPSKDDLIREAARQRYRFHLFCESWGTLGRAGWRKTWCHCVCKPS